MSLENGVSRVFTATLKHREQLCCVEVNINCDEKRDSSAKSIYHWRILKCRQLIFADPQIIASPILGTENLIHVVMDREHYGKGTFLTLLEKLNLNGKSPTPISNIIYESCLHYTLIAKIAPQWNQVGNYLVEGRDFLLNNQLLSAVTLDLSVNDINLFVTVRPMKIKLWSINLKDFDISNNIIEEFDKNEKFTISEVNINSPWIHVLPSLKKGLIVYISHSIPASCPYKTYKELRRHWKNMYGYRLPEQENGILYCTVSFSFASPTLYTYPSLCVRVQNNVTVHCSNEGEILQKFHNDLLKKLPRVCGSQIFTGFSQTPQIMGTMFTFPDFPNLNFTHRPTIRDVSTPILASLQDSILTQNDEFSRDSSQTISSSNISLMTPIAENVSQPSDQKFVPKMQSYSTLEMKTETKSISDQMKTNKPIFGEKRQKRLTEQTTRNKRYGT